MVMLCFLANRTYPFQFPICVHAKRLASSLPPHCPTVSFFLRSVCFPLAPTGTPPRVSLQALMGRQDGADSTE